MNSRVSRMMALTCTITSIVFLCSCTCMLEAPKAVITLVYPTSSATEGVGYVPLTLQFDANRSTANGQITRYQWDFGDGDGGDNPVEQHTYGSAGEYTVTLTVWTSHCKSIARTRVRVEPVIWITDRQLDCVYKLGTEGEVLEQFDLPYRDPRGITVGDINGVEWLFVACANNGTPRILQIDPLSGRVASEFGAPGRLPLSLSYSDLGQWGQRLWHIDGATQKIYLLEARTAYTWETYERGGLIASAPDLVVLPFLWDPQGLACHQDSSGTWSVWYLEGEGALLYKMHVFLRYATVWDVQLTIEEAPVPVDERLLPVSALAAYEDEIWLVSPNLHRIVSIDPSTGELVRVVIDNLPGSAAAGLEIQH